MLRAHTRSRGLGAAAGGPSLWDYDLTTGTLPPVLAVTRGTTATRVNASGLIVVEAANTPRFDFNPESLVCRGLLLEPQRTNFSTNSASAESWAGANVAVVANSVIAPDGALVADAVNATAVNASHYIGPAAFSMTAGQAYCFSIYAKAGAIGFIQILGLSNISGSSTYYANFNLSTGAVGANGGGFSGVSITPLGGGWYRCSVVGVATSNTSGRFGVSMLLGDNAARAPSFLGDGTSGVYLFGAQTEQAYMSTYIPTAGSATTRDADVLTLLDTSRAVEITYQPLADGVAQTVQVAAGAQPSSIYGWVTRVRQL